MSYIYECSICSCEVVGPDVIGELGILPFALCPTCNAGIVDYVFQTYGAESTLGMAVKAEVDDRSQ